MTWPRKPRWSGWHEALEKALQRVRMGGVKLDRILTPDERADKDAIVASLQHRLFPDAARPGATAGPLHEFLDSRTRLSDADIITSIRLMMSTPEYQVT